MDKLNHREAEEISPEDLKAAADFYDRNQNIVIGGMGEAEVNPEWSPEYTLEKLYDVSEQCGYFTSRGHWGAIDKEIYIQTSEGNFKLTFRQNKLGEIDQIISRRFWTA